MGKDSNKDTSAPETEAQAERIAELEKELAETKAKNAEAETRLAEAEKLLAKNEVVNNVIANATPVPDAEKLVRVRLDRLSNKGGAVFVSVGDRSWRIKRGVYVDIPECAYDVLRNAEAAEDIAAAYIESVTD